MILLRSTMSLAMLAGKGRREPLCVLKTSSALIS
jgi:hypothetical protein